MIEKQLIDLEEWLPVVDDQGNTIGKSLRSECHNGRMLLHPVVHLQVIGPDGSLFLQKRPITKLVQPGKWDTAVGGHIAFGEALETSLRREALEEIGLTDFKAKLALRYRWDSEIESELVFTFVTHDSAGINVHSDEVDEGRFWSFDEIKDKLGKAVFTPNFEHEFRMLDNLGAFTPSTSV